MCTRLTVNLVRLISLVIVPGSRATPACHSVKSAVSIPEDVFQGAERLARKTKRSRSRLFSDALKEYLARHTPDSVTEAMNKACSELGATKDQFVSSATRRVLERSEW